MNRRALPFSKSLFISRMLKQRRKLGWTRKKLADRTYISPVTLMNYERGLALPNIEKAYSIAVALGVTMDWLCGYDQAKEGLSK